MTLRTLTDDRYAPITSEVGFLDLPLERAANARLGWIRQNGQTALTNELAAPFPDALRELEPLRNGPRTRQLFLATRGEWTAYFDNGVDGGDPTTVISYLARTVGCRGVTAMAIPHTVEKFKGRCGQYGGVRFQLFGPNETHFLNYVRTVYAQHDGSRWQFGTTGTLQPYETPERYKARRIPDRFTSEMLEAYCRALGIELFDPAFYGPRAILVTSELASRTQAAFPPLMQVGGVTVRTRFEPIEIEEMTLAEVQRRHCIGPAADAMLAKMEESR